MITLTVSTRDVTVTDKETLTVGSVGIGIAFEFSEDWEGLNRVACFRMGDEGEVYEIILTESGGVWQTAIPAVVLTEEGEPVFAGVYGADENGDVVVPTRWGSVGIIRPGTSSESQGTMPDDPDSYWAQVLGLAASANTKAEAAQDTASEALAKAENALTTVTELQEEITGDVDAAQQAAEEAENAADNAGNYALLSKSWAAGGTGSRAGEETNNAMFWAQMAQQGAESSGYIFADVNEETGRLEIVVVGQLANELDFRIDETTGKLLAEVEVEA